MLPKDNNPQDDLSKSESQVRPSGMSHSYDLGIAIGCKSLAAAIVYHHICFWIKHNILEGHKPINGKTWMYQSIPKINAYLPELTNQQIKDALTILVNKKLIVKDCFNHDKFNKTSWYALSDESVLNIQNSKKLFDEVPGPDRQDLQTPSTNNTKDRKREDNPDGGSEPNGVAIPPPPKEKKSTPPPKKGKDLTPVMMKSFQAKEFQAHADDVAAGTGLFEMPLVKWEALCAEYGADYVEKCANAFSVYLAQNGVSYKNYYAALSGWIKRQKEIYDKQAPKGFKGAAENRKYDWLHPKMNEGLDFRPEGWDDEGI